MKKLLAIFLIVLCMNGIFALTRECKQLSLPEMLQEQADSGNPEVMYRLSGLYETGYAGVEKDSATALSLLRRSADAGYSPAMNYLGYAYATSLLGLEHNPDSALIWIERAAMSPQPDPKAFNNLGMMLLTGTNGIKKDYGKARYWLEKGDERNLPSASSMLARIYLEGLGVQPDTTLAVTLLRKAATAGLQDATYKLAEIVLPTTDSLTVDETIELGLSYYHDRIMPVAIPLIKRAADANDSFAIAVLAQCTAEGRGVKYDFNDAVELYARAAALGEPHAQFILAETLQEFPDLLDALPDFDFDFDIQDLYEAAAEKGITDASSAIMPLRP